MPAIRVRNLLARALAPSFVLSLVPAAAGHAQSFWGACNGPFAPQSNAVLDTSQNFGRFDFLSVTIPPGVTVQGIGPWPLRIFSADDVVIEGTISARGSPGTLFGGSGGPGGGPGGHGGWINITGAQGIGVVPGEGGALVCQGAASGGAGAGFGTNGQNGAHPPCFPQANAGFVNGDSLLSTTKGGAGGGGGGGGASNGGGGGGGGGGGVFVTSGKNIVVKGSVLADGGDGAEGANEAGGGGGGSGGAILLRALGTLTISPTAFLSARGGSGSPDPPPSFGGAGGDGRIRLEAGVGVPVVQGTVLPAPTTGSARAVVQDQAALGRPVVASQSTGGSVGPPGAFDFVYEFGNAWNSGGPPPQWIQVDLQFPTPVSQVVLVPDVTPYANFGTHQILVSTDGVTFLPVWSYTGPVNIWVPIVADFTAAPLEDVRFLRVETPFLGSWVAWSEIEVHEPADSDAFGCGCAGTGGFVPRLRRAGGQPQLGNAAFGYTLSRMPGGAPCGLILGLTNMSAGGIPLPFEVPGFAGCYLWVGPYSIWATAMARGTGPGAGKSFFPIPIPPDPGFVGITVYFQGFADDAGAAGPFPVVFSNAIRLTVLP